MSQNQNQTAGNTESDLLLSILGEMSLGSNSYEIIDREGYRVITFESPAVFLEGNSFAEFRGKLAGKPQVPTVLILKFVKVGVRLDGLIFSALKDMVVNPASVSASIIKLCPGMLFPAEFRPWASLDMRNALNDLGVVKFGDVPPDFVDIFSEATILSMKGQAKMGFALGRKDFAGTPEQVGYSGMIEFSGGSVSGAVIITMSQDLLSKAAAKMIGQQQDGVSEAVLNVVCELANILAGQAKGSLNRLGYELKLSSLPVMVSPEFQDMLMSVREDSCGVLMTFDGPDGSFVTEVRLFL
jgi:CheY-specific phosphatase CheX